MPKFYPSEKQIDCCLFMPATLDYNNIYFTIPITHKIVSVTMHTADYVTAALSAYYKESFQMSSVNLVCL